jgi:hypothetical protein
MTKLSWAVAVTLFIVGIAVGSQMNSNELDQCRVSYALEYEYHSDALDELDKCQAESAEFYQAMGD